MIAPPRLSGTASDGAWRPKLSVVIPVYNERATIEEILWRVQSIGIEKELIVVDDASSDGTRDFLRQLADSIERGEERMQLPSIGRPISTRGIRILFQPVNAGKGAALRRGFADVRGEIVVVQDADLEYDPREILRLLDPIDRGLADVVFGSRFIGGGPHRVLFFWHSIGNTVLTLLSNMLTNLNLTDVWTCYKAFRVEVLHGMTVDEDRFGFEPEITAKVAKAGWRVYEVPISYFGRTYADGKKIGWRDGVRGVWCTLKYNLFARVRRATIPKRSPVWTPMRMTPGAGVAQVRSPDV
jgi:glycosyltransferase involved in cell wall biosynthesis